MTDAARVVEHCGSRDRSPSGEVLDVPPRSLVVLAGLPGAGKTTLLRVLTAGRPPDVVALDAEDVAARLRPGAGRLPYRLVRPLVHGLHLLRVVRALPGPAACVLTTDPMTSPVRRAVLLTGARTSGRSLCVVLVDATAAQARSGQAGRGRELGRRRMARHVARAQRQRVRLQRTSEIDCADEVLVLPRAVARTVRGVAVSPTRLSLRRTRVRAA